MNNTQNIATLSLLQLLSEGKLSIGHGEFYENQCYVIINPQKHQTEEGENMFRFPTRLDCFVILLCAEGEFTLTCNLQKMTVGPGTVFFAQSGSIIQAADRQQGEVSVILFNEEALRKINLSLQNLLPHIGTLHQLYTLQLPATAFSYLWRQAAMVAESISQPATLAYYHDTVRNSIRAMAYTFISYLIRHLEMQDEGHGRTVHNHEEDLFRRFIHLVGQDFRHERRISFYAGQMHLTPKYLSAVIKRASGHSPAEWITHNVLIEAKNLLRYSDMSVQEVANSLHFPNQSFFGRWFKAQTGSSPKAYRQGK